MRAKKKKKKLEEKRAIRYIPLDDIKTINTEFLTEMERVKQRLMTIKDPAIITAFHEVLLSAYNAAIAIKTYEREVDYDIKLAKIDARADERRPERRRHWYWLFSTYSNRAQDIIEERAELEAERDHTEAEKKLDDDWEILFPKKEKKSKRKLRRQLKKQLEEAIKKADETPTNEAFEEPETVKQSGIEEIERYLHELADDVKVKPFAEVWEKIKDRIYLPQNEQKPAENGEKQEAEQTDKATTAEPVQAQADKAAKQLPGQMSFDEVQPQENADKPAQAQPQVTTRRPRPPRSCRKP